MSLELFSIIALLIMFVVRSVLPINLGLASYVAAFLIGTLFAGLAVEDIFGGFPGDLFVLLVGITFMLAIAQNNGTVDLLMDWNDWILFFPTAKGGIAAGWAFHDLKTKGIAPKAFVFGMSNPVMVRGEIFAGITEGWSRNALEIFRTGDGVRVDPRSKEIELAMPM